MRLDRINHPTIDARPSSGYVDDMMATMDKATGIRIEDKYNVTSIGDCPAYDHTITMGQGIGHIGQRRQKAFVPYVSGMQVVRGLTGSRNSVY